MITRHEILSRLDKAMPVLIKKYSVSAIALFGSYSRNEATAKSDIDLLVDFANPIGLQFVHLANELESILQGKVDLVSLKGMKPKYFQAIKQDLIYV